MELRNLSPLANHPMYWFEGYSITLRQDAFLIYAY